MSEPAHSEAEDDPYTKLTCMVHSDLIEVLKRHHSSATDQVKVVNQALATYLHLYETMRSDDQLVVISADGKQQRQIVFSDEISPEGRNEVRPPRYALAIQPVDLYDVSFGTKVFMRTRIEWVVYETSSGRRIKQFRWFGHRRAQRLLHKLNAR